MRATYRSRSAWLSSLSFLILCIQLAAAEGIPRADDAPQPLSPDESLARVHMPKGLAMSLVASEPQLQDPSGIAFDEWGRLFVCELHGYNIEGHLDVQELNKTGELDEQVRRIRWEFMDGEIAEEAEKLQFGVVKLLSDRDGDGVMDHHEVWADDLPPCYGLIAARGGIIAVCAPDIVFLADRDGDGMVDFRETLFTGFRVRTLERGINNPRWGFDNWIYVGGGGEGGRITGPHLKDAVDLGGTDFRIKADGSAIEPVTGRVGTFGMTLNQVGDRFPSSGGTPAIYALPIPYRYLQRNPFVASPGMNYQASDYNRGFRISDPHPWRVKRQQDPAWIKFYGSRETNSNYFSGGCSTEFYGGGRFPSGYVGNLFYCEPSLNIIHRTVLSRDRNGYVARRARVERESEFLASTDQWFRPMSLRFGPDGSLYIVDMYREIIEDYSAIPRFLQQQYGLNRGSDRGRIWRLASDSIERRETGISAIASASLSSSDLVERTQDSEAWWRLTAQRLLVERQDKTVGEALRSKIRQDQSAAGCLAALYTLGGLDLLKTDSLRIALASRFYEVRVHSLRLAERDFQDKGIQFQVLAMGGDSDSRVRLQLALSLGEMEGEAAVGVLLDLLRNYPTDRWLPAAVLSSARELATPLLIGLLDETSLHEETKDLVRPLASTIVGAGDEAQLRHVLSAVSQCDSRLQSSCLQGILDRVPPASASGIGQGGKWPVLDQLLLSEDGEVKELTVKLIVRLPGASRHGVNALFDRSLDEARDRKGTESDRLQALRILESAPFEMIEPLVSELIGPKESPAIQAAALESLNASRDARSGDAMLDGWSGYSPELRSAALAAIFSRENRIPALIEALEEGRVGPNDLSARQRERLATNKDSILAKRVTRVLQGDKNSVSADTAMSKFRTAITSVGNRLRGQEVFDRVCASCHQVEGRGFVVGPSLASITGKPNEALLLDLLNPSDKVDPEFRSYTVETRLGESFSGVLTADSPTSVTLLEAQNLEHVILRRDIVDLRSSELSLMPSNLGDILTPRDMADLISFLREAYSD
ncbi:c-type cytochrome [Verrucomicrobia bacterium]|jgi:putative membrane-bound dehydrogenase-like protein|nr:c-type cytochrome [Verrucomicrobiota bacterium]